MVDTGPAYPPLPLGDDNGIGKFAIGVSPVGTLPSFDVWSTIISQYANAPILTRLIENIFAYLDQTKNFEAFFDLIWNVDTAEGYGLDVWGRIVGVSRTLQVANGDWLGFAEALPGSLGFNDAQPFAWEPALGFGEAQAGDAKNAGILATEDGSALTTEDGKDIEVTALSPAWETFGGGIFGLQKDFANTALTGGILYQGATPTDNFRLSDEAYRTLILAKAAANITDGSIPAINRILMALFPHRGNCYVTDGTQDGAWFGFAESRNGSGFNQDSFYTGTTIATMTMAYVFAFQLSAVELSIVEQSGVLPKPTGVSASVVILA